MSLPDMYFTLFFYPEKAFCADKLKSATGNVYFLKAFAVVESIYSDSVYGRWKSYGAKGLALQKHIVGKLLYCYGKTHFLQTCTSGEGGISYIAYGRRQHKAL